MNNNQARVIVALDYANKNEALKLINRLDPEDCKLKVGKEMFTRHGPDFVEQLCTRGFDVFLDLKYHDIPNTVASACAAAADLGVWMLNVHAMGGVRMMEAARQALEGRQHKPMLIAVTVLTSMDAADLTAVGFSQTPSELVCRLAGLAQQCGLDGLVCSAQETSILRRQCGESFVLVTPGIRPADAAADDQRRVMTPSEAIGCGSDYLVIGRPITRSDNPEEVIKLINSQIKGA